MIIENSTNKKVLDWTVQNILTHKWNDASEEVIDSKILAGFKNMTFIFAITGETYKLLSGLSSNARFYVQIQDTDYDYTKQRSIDTMTPNKLTVGFILWPMWFWPIWLWPILIFRVADMVFCCGRYHLAVAGIAVADMVAPRTMIIYDRLSL